MGNLLTDNMDNWKVFFNAPLTGKQDYSDEDKDTIKKLAEQRRNLLSLENKNIFEAGDSNLKKMIIALEQLANNSAEKEIDLLYALAGDDEDKKRSINNIYQQTTIYFEDLKKEQISNINYNQKDLENLNILFWSDPNENNKNKKGQAEFIKALSAIRAQDFFINGATSRLQTLGENTNRALEEKDFNSWYKNNMFAQIVDIIETDDKYKAAALKDLQSGGKRLRASVGVLLKQAEIIGKKLANLIEKDLREEVEKAYNLALEEARKKGAIIPQELGTFERTKEQATYNSKLARSLFAQYVIEISKDSAKVVAITGSAFTVDSLSKILKDNITTVLSNRNQEAFLTIDEINTLLKEVVKNSIGSLEVKFSQTINIKFQGVIEKISNDKELIDFLDDYFLINATSEEAVKQRIEAIKKDMDNQLEQILMLWLKILKEEIPSIPGIDSEAVLQYIFGEDGIEQDLINTIKDDLNSRESSLEMEVLKAVEQYYKISWGGSGVSGHISLFNGTIGEIFATYLLRKTLGSRGTAFQQGASLQEGKQAIADIQLQYTSSDGKSKNIGLQLKQYKSNAIGLYSEEKFISLINAQRYLTEEEINSFLFLMGNQPTLQSIGDSAKADFSDLLPFLYYRLDGFLRVKHAKLDLINSLQNNFYIFNFNVIPTSIIFLFYAFKIRQEFTDTGLYNIKIFGLQGSTEPNHFGPEYAYNTFEQSERNSNILSKIETFKIMFKGKTINIDSSDSLLSVFRK